MSRMSDQKIIALTGSMGSGKSSAGRILARSFPVADCDVINARLLEEGQKGLQALQQAGLLPAGKPDKKQMAARMFSDPGYRQHVERILHPLILQELDAWAARQEASVVFAEVPLLFESGLQDHFDGIWCVICSQETALERLETGRGYTRPEALARLKAQWDPEKKAAASDWVLENSGTLEDLERQIERGIRQNFHGTER